ncbi:MAG TPA: endonuclease/exonuclease/phosphatase family protein [Actinophytocola sp.]|uniref:exodeoxyribonuclease III n=1 Tax=Actinophytocola sp. TaxID=1872138 RepID=UPI002DDD6462|nr:endonuclease/exonuclease/phosphatase family protein [Actinophytocola sp.]HEV2779227.1 endonuclease/exonuclease/phosphatase family protein [Actinophytocola sp.]
MPGLSLLTLNIANPSTDRATALLAWLAARPEDVLVLTETKASDGCRLLADAFRAAGCTVIFPGPGPGEYGVMIISKIIADPDSITHTVGYLPTRAVGAMLDTDRGPIRVIGVYVPSRDAGAEKTERKRCWLTEFATALRATGAGEPTVLLGDLNVLEPDHQPRYRFFAPFEYDFYRSLTDQHGLVDAFRHLHPDRVEHSWVGRTGDGYRYDHIHCSKDLAADLDHCEYLHQPCLARLSDHSALTARLTRCAGTPLLVSDPVEAASPPTLF